MPGRLGPLPEHVGIVMDGNGRWAKQRKKSRSYGHREGLKAAKRVVQAAADLGVRCLSLYTFSTENWKRSEREVSYLMFLIRTHLKREYDFYRKNRVRVVHSGDLLRLPMEISREIRQVEEDTAAHERLTLNLAINYGGRDEVVRAVLRLLESGSPALPITEESIRGHLDHPEIPDPDLIIRTGGELRLSNFLLWESAYSELIFSPVLWPDWGAEELEKALKEYRKRERRFGGVR